MSTCSDAKRISNRLNAQKSTGPTSIEGKNRSRGNAMTHGHCAVVIPHPDDESALLADREAAWQAELNPFGKAAQAYLIHQAVRRSGRLDRLDAVFHNTSAKRQRDAVKTHQNNRRIEVENLARTIRTDPDIAVRGLRKTSDGCDWLIKEWTAILTTIARPALFDNIDECNVVMLMGRLEAIRLKAASPIGVDARAITLHRNMVTRLKNNRDWKNCRTGDRYTSEWLFESDKKEVEELAVTAEEARLRIEALITNSIKDLTLLKAKHEIDEAIEEASLPTEATFDASDEGKLLHRYEMEHERALLRCLKEVRDLNTEDRKLTQDQPWQDFEPILLEITPTPISVPTMRNEPTVPGEDPRFGNFKDTLINKDECIPLNMTCRNPAQRLQ